MNSGVMDKAQSNHWLTTGRGYSACAIATLVLAFGCWMVVSALPEGGLRTNASVEVPQGIGFEQKLNSTIPTNLRFKNSQGETLKLSAIMNDKPVILNLVYFQCPMLCNMSMDGLVRSLSTMKLRVGEDFQVVTISFDPREGPELASTAQRTMISRYGGDQSSAGWHFLTGDEQSIVKLTDAVGFGYEYDERTGQYAHAAGIVVLTPEGRISRYISGVDYAARDLRLSLVEASAKRIGSMTDQALLLCYRYDPLTGKYGLAISRAIQFTALLTVFAMAGGISFALWRERFRLRKPAVNDTNRD